MHGPRQWAHRRGAHCAPCTTLRRTQPIRARDDAVVCECVCPVGCRCRADAVAVRCAGADGARRLITRSAVVAACHTRQISNPTPVCALSCVVVVDKKRKFAHLRALSVEDVVDARQGRFLINAMLCVCAARLALIKRCEEAL